MSDDEVKGLELRPLAHYKELSGSFDSQPTQKQYKFVDAYLKTENFAKAYVLAGYASPRKASSKTWLRSLGANRRKEPGVCFLFDMMMEEWFTKRKINMEYLLNEAMKTHDAADNARDKLDALRFVAELGGFTGKKHGGANHKRRQRKR